MRSKENETRLFVFGVCLFFIIFKTLGIQLSIFLSVAVKVKVKSLSRIQLFATPWTIAYQAPLSMEFSREEYWSGLPFPSQGELPDPGIERRSPALQAEVLPSEPPGKPDSDEYQPCTLLSIFVSTLLLNLQNKLKSKIKQPAQQKRRKSLVFPKPLCN